MEFDYINGQLLQGMPSPGRQAAQGAEPGARAGAAPSQVLVPEQAHANEGDHPSV